MSHSNVALCFLYSNSDLYDFYHYFYMLTNVLFYVSSAINPILYNLVSANYRQIFFATLSYFFLPCRHTPKRHRHPLTRHSISISSNHTLSTNIIKETAYWWDYSGIHYLIPYRHPLLLYDFRSNFVEDILVLDWTLLAQADPTVGSPSLSHEVTCPLWRHCGFIFRCTFYCVTVCRIFIQHEFVKLKKGCQPSWSSKWKLMQP